jgi:membrane protease YdiL (CAAX protease family)
MFGVEMLELRRIFIEAVFPGFVVFALWLNGWFYPLILSPLLYVKFVDKRGLEWIWFRGRNLFNSGLLGVCSSLGIILVWYLSFVYYLPPLESVSVTPYVLFTDVFWYPFYEEVAYRGFALAYLVPKEMSVFSSSLVGNLAQTLLFVSIHHRYVTSGTPLFLVPVLLLGLANGFIFLKTRNIFGCFLCHSLANTLALLIPLLT